jgi:hypothetical protein
MVSVRVGLKGMCSIGRLTPEMVAVNDREMAQSDVLHKIPRLEICRVTGR